VRRVFITDDGDEVMPDGPNLAKDAYPRVAENITWLTSVQSSMFAACSRFARARVATRRTA
jgi:hypothetical protein